MTQALEDLTQELEEAEEYLKNSLVPFLRFMFKRFYEYRAVFSLVAGCLGELDCLCALAQVSADDSHGTMCKPEILPRPEAGGK